MKQYWEQITRRFDTLKPRERALLWLAYAHGSSHSEIADVLGLKTGSIKRQPEDWKELFFSETAKLNGS